MATAVTEFFDSDTGPRERCGSYELIRLIGRGGIGSVFLAQRTDGEVEQRVAIKVVRDAAEPAFRDRFLRERPILASNSDRCFHAQDLNLREKLRLCLLVCDAISYVHRNLVIHHNLKPSNIVVDFLSPDYASPEQVRGGAACTTATDVYSLAALLYTLLTGRSPHIPEDGHEESVEVLTV